MRTTFLGERGRSSRQDAGLGSERQGQAGCEICPIRSTIYSVLGRVNDSTDDWGSLAAVGSYDRSCCSPPATAPPMGWDPGGEHLCGGAPVGALRLGGPWNNDLCSLLSSRRHRHEAAHELGPFGDSI
jgi:hypothetical protein